MPSTGRGRQRKVADQIAEEEDWDPEEWDWEPSLCQARKRRCYGANDSAVARSASGSAEPCAFGTVSKTDVAIANPKFANLPVYNTLKKLEVRPEHFCVVEGCGASLAGLKRYFTRLRICEVHLGAQAIVVDGVISRFCQQCGRFQPLHEFTGKKKSCTERLEKVNARHREKAQQKQRRPDARLPLLQQGPLPEWEEPPPMPQLPADSALDDPPAASSDDGFAAPTKPPRASASPSPPPPAAGDASLGAAASDGAAPAWPLLATARSSFGAATAAATRSGSSAAASSPAAVAAEPNLPALPGQPSQPEALAAAAAAPSPAPSLPPQPQQHLPAAAAAVAAAGSKPTGGAVGRGSAGPAAPQPLGSEPLLLEPTRSRAKRGEPVPPLRIVNTSGAGVVWYSMRRPGVPPSVVDVKPPDLVPMAGPAALSAPKSAASPSPQSQLRANGTASDGTAAAAAAAALEAPAHVPRLPRSVFWNTVTTVMHSAGAAADATGACDADSWPPPPEDVRKAIIAARSELFMPVSVRPLPAPECKPEPLERREGSESPPVPLAAATPDGAGSGAGSATTSSAASRQVNHGSPSAPDCSADSGTATAVDARASRRHSASSGDDGGGGGVGVGGHSVLPNGSAWRTDDTAAGISLVTAAAEHPQRLDAGEGLGARSSVVQERTSGGQAACNAAPAAPSSTHSGSSPALHIGGAASAMPASPASQCYSGGVAAAAGPMPTVGLVAGPPGGGDSGAEPQTSFGSRSELPTRGSLMARVNSAMSELRPLLTQVHQLSGGSVMDARPSGPSTGLGPRPDSNPSTGHGPAAEAQAADPMADVFQARSSAGGAKRPAPHALQGVASASAKLMRKASELDALLHRDMPGAAAAAVAAAAAGPRQQHPDYRSGPNASAAQGVFAGAAATRASALPVASSQPAQVPQQPWPQRPQPGGPLQPHAVQPSPYYHTLYGAGDVAYHSQPPPGPAIAFGGVASEGVSLGLGRPTQGSMLADQPPAYPAANPSASASFPAAYAPAPLDGALQPPSHTHPPPGPTGLPSLPRSRSQSQSHRAGSVLVPGGPGMPQLCPPQSQYSWPVSHDAFTLGAREPPPLAGPSYTLAVPAKALFQHPATFVANSPPGPPGWHGGPQLPYALPPPWAYGPYAMYGVEVGPPPYTTHSGSVGGRWDAAGAAGPAYPAGPPMSSQPSVPFVGGQASTGGGFYGGSGGDDDSDGDDDPGMLALLLQQLSDEPDIGPQQQHHHHHHQQQQQQPHAGGYSNGLASHSHPPPPAQQAQSYFDSMERQWQEQQQLGAAVAATAHRGLQAHRRALAAAPYSAAWAPGGAYAWPTPHAAASASGAGAAGAGSGPGPDGGPMELERVAIKAMNMQPQDLPGNLRGGLGRWLHTAGAEPLQATLRPGCLQLIVDVQRPAGAAARFGDLGSLLIPEHDPEQAAADVFRILGQRLRDTFVQVGDKVLQIRVGEDPVVSCWEDAAEDGGLSGAKMPRVVGCSRLAVCAGSDATLELHGSHLAQSRCTIFARLRGRDLPASILPADPTPSGSGSGAATAPSEVSATEADGGAGASARRRAFAEGSRLRVRVAVPPSTCGGLLAVEVGVGHLLGDWWPLVVLPAGQEGAAAEVQRLAGAAGGLRAEEDGGRVVGEVERARQAAAAAEQAGSRSFIGDLGRLLDVYSAATAAAAAAAAEAFAAAAAAAAAAANNTASTPASADPGVTPGSLDTLTRAPSSAGTASPGSPSSAAGGAGGRAVGNGSTTATSHAGGWSYTDGGADSLASSSVMESSTRASSTRMSMAQANANAAGVPVAAAPHRAEHHALPGPSDARPPAQPAAGAPPAAGQAVRGHHGRMAARAEGNSAASAAGGGGGTVAAPSVGTLRRAVAKAARLLPFVVARGCPNLTSLLLSVAESLCAMTTTAAAASAIATSGGAAAAAAAAPAPLSLVPAAAGGTAANTAAGLLSAAGIGPQTLLPLAVLSGSTETVDRLTAFAANVLRKPLRLDLPQGPAGMSTLHLSALLDDGGAMAAHLVATQPWAAWAWLALCWSPTPTPAANLAAGAPACTTAGTGGTAPLDSAPNGAYAPGAVAGEDGPQPSRQPRRLQLTPGSLSLLLGHSAPLDTAVSRLVLHEDDLVAVQVAEEEEEEPEGSAAAGAAEEDGSAEQRKELRGGELAALGGVVGAAEGRRVQEAEAEVDEEAVEAALADVVEAWTQLSNELLSALCQQLSAQRL